MFQMSDLDVPVVKLDVPHGNERSNGRGAIVIIRQLSIYWIVRKLSSKMLKKFYNRQYIFIKSIFC